MGQGVPRKGRGGKVREPIPAGLGGRKGGGVGPGAGIDAGPE